MTAKEHEYNDYVTKIVLVGESSVGKTNILTRFIKNVFDENSKSTLGVEFATKIIDIDGKKIRTQIWDTAGQERYKAITNSYYIHARGALVVFDITKNSTFMSVDRWIKELKSVAGDDIAIILIGNKSDLCEIRAVSVEEAKEKAAFYSKYRSNVIEIDYIETSALSNSNIKDAFYSLSNSKYIT